MASVPHLRRKNAAAAVGADGITGSSALLPQMQTRKHYQRKQFSNRKRISARHKGAVLTASAMRSCIASFERENHEKSLDAEAGPAGGAQLSFLHGGSDICAAGLSRLQLDGAGRQRPERGPCTFAVVLLSIVSLSMIIAAGAKDRRCRSYGICAGIALGMMLVGALGIKLVHAAYFGVVERFSVFAATGFNTALGIHLFCTRPENERPQGRI